MNEENKEEIAYLKQEGIENITLKCNDGEITLAQLLSNYAIEYFQEHDQGEWGKQY